MRQLPSLRGQRQTDRSDLTAVAKRFTRKEVLESVLFPSHVISDQYAARRVLTASGQAYNGLVTRKSDGSLVVKDSDLNEHVVSEEDIEEIVPSKVSMMPSGLFDSLSAEEIRDLFAYMGFVPTQIAEKPKVLRFVNRSLGRSNHVHFSKNLLSLNFLSATWTKRVAWFCSPSACAGRKHD